MPRHAALLPALPILVLPNVITVECTSHHIVRLRSAGLLIDGKPPQIKPICSAIAKNLPQLLRYIGQEPLVAARLRAAEVKPKGKRKRRRSARPVKLVVPIVRAECAAVHGPRP
jgi:hypothetical protein